MTLLNEHTEWTEWSVYLCALCRFDKWSECECSEHHIHELAAHVEYRRIRARRYACVSRKFCWRTYNEKRHTIAAANVERKIQLESFTNKHWMLTINFWRFQTFTELLFTYLSTVGIQTTQMHSHFLSFFSPSTKKRRIEKNCVCICHSGQCVYARCVSVFLHRETEI